MAGLIFVFIGGIILTLYIVKVSGYGVAIFRSMRMCSEQFASNEIEITLLVPVRNEEKNLPDLIHDIQIQLYPSEKLEVLFINDHSDDKTVEIVESILKENDNFRLLHLPGHLQGKKESISMGVREAKGEWIIQTDADCSLPRGFVREHAELAGQGREIFIAGPVQYAESGKLWDHIEALEFMSLIASSMGSFLSKKPVMCNGANLSYSKEFYRRNEQALKESPSPSGDDMFLLIQAKKEGMNMKYMMSEQAVVTTGSSGSLKSFLQQRIRWGAKAKFYADFEMVYLTLLTFLTNAFVLGYLVATLIDPSIFLLFSISLFIKSLADLYLLYAAAKQLRKLKLLWYFPVVALFYYFYLVFTGVASLFAGYRWKGRRF